MIVSNAANLILASASPRRKELLELAGFRFTVRARPVEEVRGPAEDPRDYVTRLARAKAEAARESAEEIVLGADTTVVLEERVLEKPHSVAGAKAMLRALACREHTVLTGICLVYRDRVIVECESTRVSFVALSEAEIDLYVASGEPMDKAGAYGIQGLASKFVDRIEGCFFNVMGLPLAVVYKSIGEITGGVETSSRIGSMKQFSLTPLQVDKLREIAAQQRQSLPAGNSGVLNGPAGVKVQFDYDPVGNLLKLEIVNKPFFLTDEVIWGQIEPWVAQARAA
jgi:septum formation protein